MNTYPARPSSRTYCWFVVERTYIRGPYAGCHPLREELARLVEVHVWPDGVRVDDGEVLCTIVDLGGDGTFGHVLDAFTRAECATARPETVENEGGRGGKGWTQTRTRTRGMSL